MTIGLALISWFLIVDFPDRAKFLSEDERRAAVDRIQRERGDALPDQLTAAKIFKHMIECVPPHPPKLVCDAHADR